MSAHHTWSQYFKPEVRSQGTKFFDAGDVFLSVAADTQIQAFVKGSSRVRVSFKTESIANPSFDVDCTCPAAGKGQFCKHIWATLLAVEKNYPDFLDSKEEIHKITDGGASTSLAAKPRSDEQLAREEQRKEVQKAKQASYRKEQYQKQKERRKGNENSQKGQNSKLNSRAVDFPEDVASAVKFFSENGFDFEQPIERDKVVNARKVLSRVFHPDKGGSHAEAVALNENFDVLINWVDSES